MAHNERRQQSNLLEAEMTDKTKDNTAAIEGTWQGAIQASASMELPLVFHFKKSGITYSGSFDSPAQGMFGMNFDSVELSADGSLHATVNALKAHYEGKFNS